MAKKLLVLALFNPFLTHFYRKMFGDCPLRGVGGVPPLSAKVFLAKWLSVKGVRGGGTKRRLRGLSPDFCITGIYLPLCKSKATYGKLKNVQTFFCQKNHKYWMSEKLKISAVYEKLQFYIRLLFAGKIDMQTFYP